MYSRRVQDRVLTFGVSGKLVLNTLVMYDHQTRSLWAQSLYQAIEGPYLGAELELVPATITAWAVWRDAHPDTLLLDQRGPYATDPYDEYYASPAAGIYGEAVIDRRLDLKDLVVGVGLDGEEQAYPLALLNDTPVVNDVVAETPVLVYFDSDTQTAMVYKRPTESAPLTFTTWVGSNQGSRLLTDIETDSVWDPITGVAIDGPMKGAALERVAAHLSFWFAWTDWNPETGLYGETPGP